MKVLETTVLIEDNNDKLTITIETDRLIIRSVRLDDLEDYVKLYADSNVMQLFATGKTRDRSHAAKRIHNWVQRQAQNDPYHGLSVFLKGKDNRDAPLFLGHVIVGYSGQAGIAELAGMGFMQFWQKGYGTEAAVALTKHLVPKLRMQQYLLGGEPLKTVIATARVDNTASRKILVKMGFSTNRVVDYKFNSKRYIYRIAVNPLVDQYKAGHDIGCLAVAKKTLNHVFQWVRGGVRCFSRPLSDFLVTQYHFEQNTAQVTADVLVSGGYVVAASVSLMMLQPGNATEETGLETEQSIPFMHH